MSLRPIKMSIAAARSVLPLLLFICHHTWSLPYRNSKRLGFNFNFLPLPPPDPIHYGNFCGPTPEITPASNCKDTRNKKPIDKVDSVCYMHDRRYCSCERYYTDKGQDPPLAALIAMRSFSYAFSFSPLDKLDAKYYRCIHEADQELIKGFDEIIAKNDLPVRWDGFTRYRFVNLLNVFKRNMPLDDAVLSKLEAKEPAYTLTNSKSSPASSPAACEPEESELQE